MVVCLDLTSSGHLSGYDGRSDTRGGRIVSSTVQVETYGHRSSHRPYDIRTLYCRRLTQSFRFVQNPDSVGYLFLRVHILKTVWKRFPGLSFINRKCPVHQENVEELDGRIELPTVSIVYLFTRTETRLF